MQRMAPQHENAPNTIANQRKIEYSFPQARQNSVKSGEGTFFYFQKADLKLG